MHLPPFQIHRPETVVETLDLLRQYEDDGAVYAGGTELLLVMKLGFADFGHLIDLKTVSELGGCMAGESSITIGATATHRMVERDPAVRERYPSLAMMVSNIGNLRVRSAGTLAGNLAFADPHSDPATFLTAMGGHVSLIGDAGRRSVPIESFVLGPYETERRDDEIITALNLPYPDAGTRVIHKHVRLQERPFLTVTVAGRPEDARIADARVAIGAVVGAPRRLTVVEELFGAGITQDPSVYEAVTSDLQAYDDAHGSADYKRHLAALTVTRAANELIGASQSLGGRT